MNPSLTDAADKDLFGLVGLALALGRGVLRVDLLSVETVRGDAEDAVDRVRRGEGDEAESAAPLQREGGCYGGMLSMRTRSWVMLVTLSSKCT